MSAHHSDKNTTSIEQRAQAREHEYQNFVKAQMRLDELVEELQNIHKQIRVLENDIASAKRCALWPRGDDIRRWTGELQECEKAEKAVLQEIEELVVEMAQRFSAACQTMLRVVASRWSKDDEVPTVLIGRFRKVVREARALESHAKEAGEAVKKGKEPAEEEEEEEEEEAEADEEVEGGNEERVEEKEEAVEEVDG